jgi:MraZ protein
LVFRGTFDHALDAKNRLTVPAKFRTALADGVVLAGSPEVTPGEARSLSIWTPDAYDAFTASTLSGLNPLSPTARELKRFFFNHSLDTELDAAGRVMIPAFLMRYASLGKDVVVTGSGECLEVWERATFTSYQDAVLARIPDLAASLGNTA